MSKSPLVSYTKISPHNGGARPCAVDRITPHCVVGQCTIEALGALFAQPSRRASSNYGIDRDGRIGLFVDEDCVSWCSSSAENDRRAVTIECASDTAAPWAFRDVVFRRLAALCTDVCRRNGRTKLLWIPEKDAALSYVPAADEMLLTVHRWFAATACPGDWMMERMGALAETVTAALTPQGNWYDGAMAWAEAAGLIRDGRPNDPVTRAELATVLQRALGQKEESI